MENTRYWVYQPRMFPHNYDGKSIYATMLEELRPYLSVGEVTIMGKKYVENRETCYFSLVDGDMTYSGRKLEPIRPPKGSMVELIMNMAQDPDFQNTVIKTNPELAGKIPKFNAVFINWYRPPGDTEKNDGLGPHSDDEKYLAHQTILSLTFCEKNGERIFKFHEKKGSTKTVEQFELPDGAALWMLPGCQDNYKHSVSDRKTNLAGENITGGRINLTLRCVKEN